MTRLRTTVPAEVAADLLFSCDSTCCVCEGRGKTVQIHHLDSDPSNHRIANLAVLCLECHNQTQIRGGFGRKLSKELIIKHRDEWILRVKSRRQEADRIIVEYAVGRHIRTPAMADKEFQGADVTPREEVLEYINSLPGLKAELLASMQPEWDTGVTLRMVQASSGYIEALSGILCSLADFYPKGHFRDMDPDRFFADQIAARFEWHRLHAEPDGFGTGGTIVNIVCCKNAQADVEKMIEDIVMSIIGFSEDFDETSWQIRWNGPTT